MAKVPAGITTNVIEGNLPGAAIARAACGSGLADGSRPRPQEGAPIPITTSKRRRRRGTEIRVFTAEMLTRTASASRLRRGSATPTGIGSTPGEPIALVSEEELR